MGLQRFFHRVIVVRQKPKFSHAYNFEKNDKILSLVIFECSYGSFYYTSYSCRKLCK